MRCRFSRGNTFGILKIPLWEDIQRKFVQRLDDTVSTPHFLGAMVLDQRRSYGNSVPVQLIIDGQQRLTTFQIFLSVFGTFALPSISKLTRTNARYTF